MRLTRFAVPATLAFNLLAAAAIATEPPENFNDLTDAEKEAFFECQMNGPSEQSLETITKIFEQAERHSSTGEDQNDERFDAVMEIFIEMAVIPYYACGLDFNIDPETMPQPTITGGPNPAPPR